MAELSHIKKRKVDYSMQIVAENNQNYADYVQRRQDLYSRVRNPNSGLDVEVRANFNKFARDRSYQKLYRLSRSHKESMQIQDTLKSVESTIERFRMSGMGKLNPSQLNRQSTVSFADQRPEIKPLSLGK